MTQRIVIAWISAEAGYLYYLHGLIRKHIRDNYNDSLCEKELLDKLYYLGIAIKNAKTYAAFKSIHKQLEFVLKCYNSLHKTALTISKLMKDNK